MILAGKRLEMLLPGAGADARVVLEPACAADELDRRALPTSGHVGVLDERSLRRSPEAVWWRP